MAAGQHWRLRTQEQPNTPVQQLLLSLRHCQHRLSNSCNACPPGHHRPHCLGDHHYRRVFPWCLWTCKGPGATLKLELLWCAQAVWFALQAAHQKFCCNFVRLFQVQSCKVPSRSTFANFWIARAVMIKEGLGGYHCWVFQADYIPAAAWYKRKGAAALRRCPTSFFLTN